MVLDNLRKLVCMVNDKTHIPKYELAKYELMIDERFHNEFHLVDTVMLVGKHNDSLCAIAAYFKGNNLIAGETTLQTFNLSVSGWLDDFIRFGERRGFYYRNIKNVVEQVMKNYIEL